MKKIKAMALAAVMCAGIIAGCSSEVAENTEVTTVSIWHTHLQ